MYGKRRSAISVGDPDEAAEEIEEGEGQDEVVRRGFVQLVPVHAAHQQVAQRAHHHQRGQEHDHWQVQRGLGVVQLSQDSL